MIHAIDPGPEQSAVVSMDDDGTVHSSATMDNDRLLVALRNSLGMPNDVAIEMVASYGMPVGADVFETCVWIGRFIEAARDHYVTKVYRKDVKMNLCGNVRAKDSNIRQALVDRYGPGKEYAVGTKKARGPLYGVKSHEWAALAVGVTHIDTHRSPYDRLHNGG